MSTSSSNPWDELFVPARAMYVYGNPGTVDAWTLSVLARADGEEWPPTAGKYVEGEDNTPTLFRLLAGLQLCALGDPTPHPISSHQCYGPDNLSEWLESVRFFMLLDSTGCWRVPPGRRLRTGRLSRGLRRAEETRSEWWFCAEHSLLTALGRRRGLPTWS